MESAWPIASEHRQYRRRLYTRDDVRTDILIKSISGPPNAKVIHESHLCEWQENSKTRKSR